MKNKRIGIYIRLLPIVFSVLAVLLSIVLIIFFRTSQKNTGENIVTTTEVEIGNVTDSSFTVFFKTSKENASFVEYGVLGSFNLKAYPVVKGKQINNLVTIGALLPTTEYNFRVVDENSKVISEETTIKTGPSLAFPPSQPFFGRLFDKNREPIANSYLIVDIYGTTSTPSKIITTSETNGSFTFNTGSVRSSDFSSYAFPKLEAIKRIDILGKTYDGREFSLTLNAPFEKLSLGAVQLGEIKTNFENVSKKIKAEVPRFLWGPMMAYAANTISFDFPAPGRWDIAIYTPVSTPIGALEFLSKLNTGCSLDAYWLDQLQNGAWESFILKDGVEYGRSFPIMYTKAYFVVIQKAVNNCSFEI